LIPEVLSFDNLLPVLFNIYILVIKLYLFCTFSPSHCERIEKVFGKEKGEKKLLSDQI
jgi:hypothetical protein